MKLKIAILASSFFFPFISIADEIKFNWQSATFDSADAPLYSKRFSETKEDAIKKAIMHFPITVTSDSSLDVVFNSKKDFVDYLATNIVTDMLPVPYNGYGSLFTLPVSFNITNLVTGEYIDRAKIYGSSSKTYLLVRNSFLLANKSTIGLRSILKDNSVYFAESSSNKIRVHLNLSGLFYNVLTSPESVYNELVIQNFEEIKNYLTQIGSNSSDLLTIVEAIEMNQLNTHSELGNIIDKNAAITNLLYGISINSTYANNRLETIKTVAQTFAEDQRIKQLASGETYATLISTDTASGPLYEALDQLIRLNYLKQGISITDSELSQMTRSDKWSASGMSSKYGSFSDNMYNGNIGKIVAVEAITENKKFQDKVSDLSSIADDNGNVIDPLTGELTKLTNAIKDWDKGKVDGALASYQYNNPAATNGFFGEIKRTLTEEGDWRLLDKGIKEKQESFMDNITQDGVKINTKQGPIAVTVNNDDGLIVNFPDEVFQSKIFKTSNSTLDIWYDKWIDWKILWSNFTGVENHNDRGFLDIMLERNDLYYSYVTNKMYGTVSNQLARLIELNEYTNRLNFVDVPRATYVRYLMRGIGTTENNDDDLFAIKDEPTFAFDGSTNFEQAVAFQLHDLFEVSQNGSKADMMAADFIRGIYQLLGTGSNIAVQVAYITNTVYKANGLSTDKNNYSSYEQEKEKLEADLEEVSTILEDMQTEVKEKINYVSVRLFADYTLPKSVTLLEFNNQKFEIDLYKWSKIFDMMHMCSQVAWLAVGLLMLPRVIYMLLCFGLKMLGRFYNIMRS